MTLVDAITLLALGFFLMRGVKEGMLARAATVIGFFLALVVVRNYYVDLQGVIIGLPDKSYLTAIIAVAVLAGLFGYALRLMDKSLDFAKMVPGIGSMNKLGGAILGILEGVVILSLVVYGSYNFWGEDVVEEFLANTLFATLLQHSTNFVTPIVKYLLDIV